MTPISKLKKGQVGRVICLQGNEDVALRLMEMGLYAGDHVQLVDKLFFGKNLIIMTKDGKYVFRTKEAQCIKVEILPHSSLLGSK